MTFHGFTVEYFLLHDTDIQISSHRLKAKAFLQVSPRGKQTAY